MNLHRKYAITFWDPLSIVQGWYRKVPTVRDEISMGEGVLRPNSLHILLKSVLNLLGIMPQGCARKDVGDKKLPPLGGVGFGEAVWDREVEGD